MSKNLSIFDVLGPVMIGPSSSHTAGAARLGKMARYICEEDISSVEIQLHGSFKETGKGHGTEMALVAGLMGFEPDDERLRKAMDLAQGTLAVSFKKVDLGYAHPNTARFIIEKSDGVIMDITGSSLGGGEVIITNINGFEVALKGNYFTIITKHFDKRGIISQVTTLLSKGSVNIGNMKVSRNIHTQEAIMVIETDEGVPTEIIKQIKGLNEMIGVMIVNPVRGEIHV